MTHPDLDAIRARCDAATPGPWHVKGDPGWWRVYSTLSDVKVFDDGSAGEEYAQVVSLKDRDFIVAARNDIPALLAYIEELERAVENEQLTFASCNRARIHCENECDSLHARINEMHDEIDKAQAAFDHGCGQDGPDGWEPGETAVDALVRAKHGRDALREEMFAWQHAVEYVLGEDWMAADGHGPKEARAELARRAKESADEYASLKHREVMLKRAHGALADAGCIVPIEFDRTIEHAINALAERALTAEERLERVTRERDQERTVFERAMTEAQTDVMELRARIAELEKR